MSEQDGSGNDPGQQPQPQDQGNEPLGEGGKKALEAERKERQRLESELKAARDQIEEAKRAQMTEAERMVQQAREEAAKEVASEYGPKLLAARVQAAAVEFGFHDPGDVRLDGLSPDSSDDELKAAIKELAEKKPYLVRSRTPSVPQGPRSSTTPASDPDAWLRKVVGH